MDLKKFFSFFLNEDFGSFFFDMKSLLDFSFSSFFIIPFLGKVFAHDGEWREWVVTSGSRIFKLLVGFLEPQIWRLVIMRLHKGVTFFLHIGTLNDELKTKQT